MNCYKKVSTFAYITVTAESWFNLILVLQFQNPYVAHESARKLWISRNLAWQSSFSQEAIHLQE